MKIIFHENKCTAMILLTNLQPHLPLFCCALGLLMVIDIPQERGLGYADYRWGDPEECRFPLLNFLQVLPIQWMYIVYLAMFCGRLSHQTAVYIRTKNLYRISCKNLKLKMGIRALMPLWQSTVKVLFSKVQFSI